MQVKQQQLPRGMIPINLICSIRPMRLAEVILVFAAIFSSPYKPALQWSFRLVTKWRSPSTELSFFAVRGSREPDGVADGFEKTIMCKEMGLFGVASDPVHFAPCLQQLLVVCDTET